MVQKNYNKKILIISSNFYPEITRNLLDGVTQVLDNEKKNYESKFVRGSLELPFFLEKYKNKIACVIMEPITVSNPKCMKKKNWTRYYLV